MRVNYGEQGAKEARGACRRGGRGFGARRETPDAPRFRTDIHTDLHYTRRAITSHSDCLSRLYRWKDLLKGCMICATYETHLWKDPPFSLMAGKLIFPLPHMHWLQRVVGNKIWWLTYNLRGSLICPIYQTCSMSPIENNFFFLLPLLSTDETYTLNMLHTLFSVNKSRKKTENRIFNMFHVNHVYHVYFISGNHG